MTKIEVQETTDTKFNKNWKLCIGSGRLGLALQKEYVDHLKIAQEKIGFDYIRGHGLLHDDVGIYREIEVDGEKRPFYNFTYIDKIFDSYQEIGIRPFVEIGFMPELLASGKDTLFTWKGNITPPNDYGKWSELIKEVVSHFIERYGEAEVEKWPFEIWNEPNLVNFWKDANKEEYFKLYKVTVDAIKEVHSNIQVGGPAICGGTDEWIDDFLHFCEDEDVPVDFVSRHAYTSKQPHKVTPDYYYQDLADNTKMLEEFRKIRGMIDASPYPDLPLHITEYNSSYSPINPVHDTVLNAAYLARILSEGGDYVDSFSYWTFSDVFEERDVPRAQFHGGFGLIAWNDILKPTFHLFSFFNALGEEQLYRDDKTLVTRRKDGTIALVAWNLVTEKGEGFEKELEYTLHVSGDDYFVKRQTVDEGNANPWEVWKQMGRPRFPSKEKVETLKQAAQPFIRTSRTKSENGRIAIKIQLTKNEITLIEFTPIKDETDSYIGLDDSLITSYS
ncbi:xylan 1,4-beta-xylosidase [Virgibacillus natechei]|uniref:Xylan 1,4-beta-xylosidase n=1 Tax=Virgibacillus natechei TaxID=1216297 RepID=A0ABS4IEK5_9BACI|nr:xylan 1,4-beta-xylosidase [Virgibacillus natechei]MBP1969330.1 xylan 1,4-beta-xylosidase [Virgibacillus natechei]UZD12482.1 xylan 1,4-beta-xylosidase [Virgibacillus natechei]